MGFQYVFFVGYIIFKRRLVEYLANLQTFCLTLKPFVLLLDLKFP